MSCYTLTGITCFRKEWGYPRGKVIVQITMNKLNLTSIQHILGVMPETLPVLSRIGANLNMQHKAAPHSVSLATAKWSAVRLCCDLLFADNDDVIAKHSNRKWDAENEVSRCNNTSCRCSGDKGDSGPPPAGSSSLCLPLPMTLHVSMAVHSNEVTKNVRNAMLTLKWEGLGWETSASLSKAAHLLINMCWARPKWLWNTVVVRDSVNT